ncbi:MAG: hypothetical protein AB1Z98_31920 [Nannocystaceae bacterium]
MGTVELAIILDESGATYHPGDPITGRVELTVEEGDVHGALRAVLMWECHGRDIAHTEVMDRLDPSGGARRWSPGSHSFAFRFVCPVQPVSYEGEFFAIELAVRVEVQLDDEAPVEHELSVRSTLGPHQAPTISMLEERPLEHVFGENHWDATIVESQRGSALRRLPGIAGHLVRFSEDVAAILTGKQRSASARIRNLELEYEPGAGAILVHLRIDPPPNAAPDAFEATLALYECATHPRSAFGRVEQLSRATGKLQRTTDDLHYEGTVELPDFVALSFECSQGAIRWNLQITNPRGAHVATFPLRAHLDSAHPQGYRIVN